MKMNEELRHKQNVMQAQLKSTVERKADMEADLKEKNKEIENLLAQLSRTTSNSPVHNFMFTFSLPKQSFFIGNFLLNKVHHVSFPISPLQISRLRSRPECWLVRKRIDPDQPCFTKKEVRDIIVERNELKTNLFLVQEELNYYQRYRDTLCVLMSIHICEMSELIWK